MVVICEITEKHNNLKMSQDENVIVVPNDRIDEFISALQRHCSSEGDSESFTFGAAKDRLIPTYYWKSPFKPKAPPGIGLIWDPD